MKSSLSILLIILCLTIAGCSSKNDDGFDVVDHADHGKHSEKPSLDAKVKVDGNTANVFITTSMKISKEKYGKEKKSGEGHVHLYLDDGEKQGVTDSHVSLNQLTKGMHTIKISLHNNDHTPYDVTKTLKFTIK